MGYALLFSGQGDQHPAMFQGLLGPDGEARVAAAIGGDWRTAAPAWLQRNVVAQPLLTALAVSTTDALLAGLAGPQIVAGYSVGELAACHAAGVLSADQAIALARVRAAEMARDAAAVATGLAGCSGLDSRDVEALCAAHGLDLAIRMAPDSVVLGGPSDALAGAAGDAQARGARWTLLPIGLASHTRWMQAAAQRFEAHLAGEALAAPRCRLATNQAGVVRSAEAVRRALARQIASTVAWDEVLDAVLQTRVDAVLEIGPGRALARMLERRDPTLPVRAVEDFRSLAAVQRWLARFADG